MVIVFCVYWPMLFVVCRDILGSHINERAPSGGLDENSLVKLRLLGDRLGQLSEFAALGKLSAIRNSLPDYYRANDRVYAATSDSEMEQGQWK